MINLDTLVAGKGCPDGNSGGSSSKRLDVAMATPFCGAREDCNRELCHHLWPNSSHSCAMDIYIYEWACH